MLQTRQSPYKGKTNCKQNKMISHSTEGKEREQLRQTKKKKKTQRTWKLTAYLEEKVRLSAQLAPLLALVSQVLSSLPQLAL